MSDEENNPSQQDNNTKPKDVPKVPNPPPRPDPTLQKPMVINFRESKGKGKGGKHG